MKEVYVILRRSSDYTERKRPAMVCNSKADAEQIASAFGYDSNKDGENEYIVSVPLVRDYGAAIRKPVIHEGQ